MKRARRAPSRRFFGSVGFALTVAVVGCASPADPKLPAELPAAAEVGLAEEAGTMAAAEGWWRQYGDQQLDDLVAQALVATPTLHAALARAQRAQAIAAGIEAANGPQVALRADATWQRYSERGLYPPPIAGTVRNSGDLGLSGSVALDFFGRHAAALRAALGTQRAAEADLHAARSMLTTSVVRGYFALARLEGLLQLGRRAVALREAQRALAGERVAAGLDPRTELLAAETARADSQQQLEALAEQGALARHALAVLCGLAPQALDDLRPTLPTPQAATLPTRLGADLLGRRADVQAARWRVEASAADVAEARASFYPDINLVAFADFAAFDVVRLLALPNREYGVGPALRLPIFDGGHLRAQQRGREAELDAAIAAYRGVVLDAVREATDAIASLRSLDQQRTAQTAGMAAAELAWQSARDRRRQGLGNELQVLAAEWPLLAQRRAAVDLSARTFEGQATLFHALGGGWQAGGETPAPLRPLAAAPMKASP